MQIHSLAEDVWCKASALAALALARNTYVSAINLQQCSAADLNPYNIGVYEEIILNLKFKEFKKIYCLYLKVKQNNFLYDAGLARKRAKLWMIILWHDIL